MSADENHDEFIKKVVLDHVSIRAKMLRQRVPNDDEYQKRLKSLVDKWLRIYPTNLTSVIVRNKNGEFDIEFEQKKEKYYE